MAMTAVVVNGFPAIGFFRFLRLETTNRKLSSRSTHSSGASVSLHVKRSVFKTNSSLRSKDFSELKELDGDGGPPRWFSPLECGPRSTGSPLLLFLPGIDGVGLGLMSQHKRLGEIFDIWCLHIPIMDRTPFADLVMLIQNTVRLEHDRVKRRPIYLVGESIGASLALAVAAQNPNIDLVLILANPATSLSKSFLQNVVHLVDDYMIDHGMINIPAETIMWKLRMIHEMQSYLDSHLRAVEAQTLVLNSGNDMLLSSITEREGLLRSLLKRCEVRSFIDKGFPLFMDESFDLVATIKRVSYYRRRATIDYVSDFLPPSSSDFKMILEPFRWMETAFNPVMITTKDNGELMRGFVGIPSEGPVLLVGNHMLKGMDIIPLLSQFYIEKNILVRGMGHPFIFERLKKNGGKLPDLSLFDVVRVLGGVPVSATNLYKLFSVKSHVLLYPGGVREALHRKGEEHKLFWPIEPEFVRMAARFGAKIVPFGAVGEDDMVQLLLDFDDQMTIPPLKAMIEELTSEAIMLRSNAEGEVAKQLLHYPIVVPKLPGRLYFLFGKPISTQGREDILRNKEKANEMYLEIQNEVQKCIDYLKEKREKDPYRNLLARLAYQGFNGFDSQVPTFDI